MQHEPVAFELWFSHGDEGELVAVLQGIESRDGQRYWVADRAFGPFDDRQDVCNWVWSQMHSALPVKVLT